METVATVVKPGGGCEPTETTERTKAVEAATNVVTAAILAATPIVVVTPIAVVRAGAEAGPTSPPTASVEARFKMRSLQGGSLAGRRPSVA